MISKQLIWAHLLAAAILQHQVVCITPCCEYKPALPESRYITEETTFTTYNDLIAEISKAASKGKIVVILETHGDNGLGFGTAEINRPTFEITSKDRMIADMPIGIRLAIIATCNPRVVLGHGEILPEEAIRSARRIGIKARRIVIHDLYEDITIQDSRIILITTYLPLPFTYPVIMIAPNAAGLTSYSADIRKRSQVDVFILASCGTAIPSKRMSNQTYYPTKQMLKQADTILYRMANLLRVKGEIQ